ncbi:hypothetical protein A343_1788 [Porphyromonas gingivalis JCVI SC001]|nr:hypothetical protein A343_1788 [Porphyromonas gingivalis JCVI SC001]
MYLTPHTPHRPLRLILSCPISHDSSTPEKKYTSMKNKVE